MSAPESEIESAAGAPGRPRRLRRTAVAVVAVLVLWVLVSVGWAVADRRALDARAATIDAAWTAAPGLIAQGKAGTLFVPHGVGPRWSWGGNAPISGIVGTGQAVTVHVVGGACDLFPWKVVVRETDRLVVLDARPDVKPWPEPSTWRFGPQGCTAQGVDHPVDVELAAAVGDRLVVDAWSGAPVQQMGS